MRITHSRVLTGLLLLIVALAWLTHDNFWIVGPVALATIIYAAIVGWQNFEQNVVDHYADND